MSDKSADITRLMRMLSHPQRMCIMCHLAQHPCHVGELVELCGISQAQVSQFLSRMTLEGFIKPRPVGRKRIYHITDNKALAVMKALSAVYCNNKPNQTTTKGNQP